MSKIDELIKEMCPNGVEYKTIQEVCVNICSGGTPKTSISEYYGGDIPWVRTQEVDWNYIYDTDVKITEEGLANSSAKWIPANCIIVAMYGATAAKVTINKIPVTTNQACCNLEINENIVLIRYVYHFLCNEYENLKGMGQGSQSNINAQMIKNYRLPIPPLPIQREIVRILDSFTELTEELTKELTKRNKQYEYYRDYLLSFKENTDVKNVTLGELFETRNGYTPSKKNKYYWASYDIPWFRLDDIRKNGNILNKSLQGVSNCAIKRSVFPKNSLIISTSATIGEYAMVTCDFLCNQRFTCLMIKDKYKNLFNMKFLYYYCHELSIFCKNSLNVGNFASVDMAKFNNFMFPMPPLKTQERIVSILDRFDTLCNDISKGLPAEIKARNKQYEYYRNKLLTFKKS